MTTWVTKSVTFSLLTLPSSTNHFPKLSSYGTKVAHEVSISNKSLSCHARYIDKPFLFSSKRTRSPIVSMATSVVEEVHPPVLNSGSDAPSLFDGTTRKRKDSVITCMMQIVSNWLYTSYICPYAQRVWIARNYKGLHDKIKLVPIDLEDRPAWYKEKVYSVNKVPSLEHNNEVKGESLDLIKYVDSHFEGPALYPDDPPKKEYAEELLSYSDTFNMAVFTSLKGDSENEISAAFDHLETALSKFDDGPFFLGQFSLVDIAYAPFIERFHPLLLDVKEYDITAGRPLLVSWIEELNKVEGYKQTKRDPQELMAAVKKKFMLN